ncbi:MAG: bifunctional proline dehydrogenase/L-glutamate gamma-semialdehyde dehydrogenase PutA, partial [Brachymonas sp.]|nr:bifunctional proline dehydrogenase/L-glutamate gamma-semialdehyde dehydrogenase PutA [Brachymonas sp.]
VDMAMRLMGEQFVTGETIAQALANSRKYEAQGFRYSYDMLGEAATTMQDADRYLAAYEQAIHAIGKASNRRGIYEGPGISIKLSALHPRYSRAQQDRVQHELLPRLRKLALLARQYDIGLNIDAEEADRLELSLDLLEALCFDAELAGWNGIGFVVQAYQKRCPWVIDYLIDLARRSRHRLMVRLVKGAYWDSEIKRAQVDGMEDYPVYTRKVHTDVAYLACARKLLAVPDVIYPQFATHNAQTAASIYHLAGSNYCRGQYEFQCLHGMGEPLYEEITAGKYQRPCRIYAPVGTHETLLAYLVRRLLENGANSSFVNRIGDEAVPVEELAEDPVAQTRTCQPLGAPHPRIPLPRHLFGDERLSAQGLDLANEQRLASLSAGLLHSAATQWHAAPLLANETPWSAWPAARIAPVLNPADQRDVVGHLVKATEEEAQTALHDAQVAQVMWQSTSASERAACLRQAADLMEAQMPQLMGLIVREAGKSLPNAISEVREAVDFLRYYAAQAEQQLQHPDCRPLGTVLCISPWNFPLAIFTGQVAAALAAGNTVIAKPAEPTPLIAAQAVLLLRQAGVPAGAVQLVPGSGRTIGNLLVADARTDGVLFTGSTEVARTIQQTLAQRLSRHGQPIPLVAETGGQNAMVVDSSALPEQVVGDVLASAFDSAGQRCSALRVLCLQDDVANAMLHMLKGAMQQLRMGNPHHLRTDVGPVIDTKARATIEAHIERMRGEGCLITQLALPEEAAQGHFVPPTLIEIADIGQLQREVFGPVLHVLRYKRDQLPVQLQAINSTGYGLTFGIHTRIDETVAQLSQGIEAGNVYVNRNTIGAVVGVQPFGGEGLSGTGPKAGGPLYLSRLLAQRPLNLNLLQGQTTASSPAQDIQRPHRNTAWQAFASWLLQQHAALAGPWLTALQATPLLGDATVMPGPTGESNQYLLQPRGAVWCQPASTTGALAQLAAALAGGNTVVWHITDAELGKTLRTTLESLPHTVRGAMQWHESAPTNEANEQALEHATHELAAVLFEGDSDILQNVVAAAARRSGPLLPVYGLSSSQIAAGTCYDPVRLVNEKTISINTAAAGGNASLMTLV